MTDSPHFAAAKITVSDIRRSYDFYTRVLGLKDVHSTALPAPVLDDPDVAWTQAALNHSGSAGDPFLCLVKRGDSEPDRQAASLTCIALWVDDVRASLSRITDAGFPAHGDLVEIPGFVVTTATDPDGYQLELFQAEAWPPEKG